MNASGTLSGTITLIDVRAEGLTALAKKLKAALRAFAERSIVNLRAAYEQRRDLVDNADIIAEHVDQGMSRIQMSTALESAAGAEAVFEAVPEDADLKGEVLARLAEICPATTPFFSATCSIPVSELSRSAEGRVMATRFYLPVRERAVVELAAAAGTSEETRRAAATILAWLGKRVVPSPDRAGFIGSAFMAREALYALKRVAALEREWGFPAATYMMDKVSREWLIRPIGIFELIDSTGLPLLDVIMQNMRRSHGAEDLHSAALDRCLEAGRVGGR
jgi:3-hydroxybutyryl-CoA dehydrogenase